MTTGIASGLGATLGVVEESAVGTFEAPTRWPAFLKESLALSKKTVQAEELDGDLYLAKSGRAYTSHTVDGTIELNARTQQLGLWLKHMIGSTPIVTKQGATNAYLQTHAPGDKQGKSLSVQVGRPQTNGTIQPFSYNGLKVVSWDLSIAVDGILRVQLNVDGWAEDTTQPYAAPSYLTPAPVVLHFAEAALVSGGTASTSAGITTVTGGTPVAKCKSVSVKGTDKLATSRYFLGANGTKDEQIADGKRALSGSMDVEFANMADVQTVLQNDTSTALQLTFTGPQIDTGENAFLKVLLPAVYFDKAPVNAEGPAILTQKVSFTGLRDDEAGNPAVQFQYQSLDATP